MHELVLFGQVPQARHDQVLKILAGLAAMQPERVLERHVVYKPTRDPPAPGRQGQVGGVQNVVATDKRHTQNQAAKDLYYTQLVQTLKEEHFDAGEGSATAKGEWAFQFYDVPDTAKRQAQLRLANITTITEGDAHRYMNALAYKYVSEYIVDGHRYVHDHIVILLHQVLLDPTSNTSLQSPNSTLPKLETLNPLDPSGTYVLQASVRLMDNPGPDIINKGQAELVKFQNDIKGVVELKMVDRLAMDTRVKSTAVRYQ